MNSPLSIENELYSNYIRYDRLYNITKYAFYGKTDANSVDIMIDMRSLTNILYMNGLNLTIKNRSVVAASMINLCAHMRSYFETRHHVSSRIFIVFGDNAPESAIKHDMYYNSKSITKYQANDFITALILENVNLLKIICPYLHDIFMVDDTSVETGVLMQYLINHHANELVPKIILTKDPYCYQLVGLNPMTFIYRPKKNGNNDVSFVVTKSNLYSMYRFESGLVPKEKTNIFEEISPRLLSLIMSLSGLKSRSMYSLVNINVAFNIILRGIHQHSLLNEYNSAVNIKTILNDLDVEKHISKLKMARDILCTEDNIYNYISERFKAVDILYQEAEYEQRPSCLAVANNVVNLYNPDSVRYINDKYFSDIPLDLNRL